MFEGASSKQDSNSENVPLILVLVSVCGDSEFEASRATRVLLRPDVRGRCRVESPAAPHDTKRSGSGQLN